MTRKSGLTHDEHLALDARLRAAHAILLEGAGMVCNAYPVAGREAVAAWAAVRAIERLLCRLDTAIIRTEGGR